MQALVDLFTTLIQLIFVVALVLAAVAVWGYNTLRKLAENVKEAQSNVDIALRKKVSLINRLSEMANQYREGEKLVMLKVSQDNSEAAMRDSYSSLSDFGGSPPALRLFANGSSRPSGNSLLSSCVRYAFSGTENSGATVS